MLLKRLQVGVLGTNCYVLGCELTGEGAVIDPGGDGDRILQEITSLQLQIKYIIHTHGHGDHIAANGELKEATGARILIHEGDASFLTDPRKSLISYSGSSGKLTSADQLLQEGDQIKIGEEITLQVIHTPGHTPGCICLDEGQHLFSGDTLFAGSIGRTDLPGGSYRSLIESVEQKVFTLTGDRIIYPGHGPETTLADEKASNPFFR
ncbi:MAG TPA: MBL fold metallo-hydrolase [Clostridia bacterium]|nr:MBL fold metallo-hydrolase [Clostridia bacterium]